MREAAFNQAHRPNHTAIAVVVLIHGAAITALGLSKMEVITEKPPIIDVFNIPNPPPPPKPPEPQQKVVAEPQHVSVVTAPKPLVIPPIRFDPIPAVDPQPQPKIEPYSRPGPVDVLPSPPPPPPPEPRKVESARAKANLASYVSDTDYPAAALRAEEQGIARFRLTVGVDGRVNACTITGSSGSSSLDAATCRIMKSRARFTPARDSDGRPTGDTVSNAIRWVLPD